MLHAESSRQHEHKRQLWQLRVPLWVVGLFGLPLLLLAGWSSYPQWTGSPVVAPVLQHAVVHNITELHVAHNLCGAQYAPLYESISHSLSYWNGKLTQDLMLNSATRASKHTHGGVSVQVKDSRMYVVA